MVAAVNDFTNSLALYFRHHPAAKRKTDKRLTARTTPPTVGGIIYHEDYTLTNYNCVMQIEK